MSNMENDSTEVKVNEFELNYFESLENSLSEIQLIYNNFYKRPEIKEKDLPRKELTQIFDNMISNVDCLEKIHSTDDESAEDYADKNKLKDEQILEKKNIHDQIKAKLANKFEKLSRLKMVCEVAENMFSNK